MNGHPLHLRRAPKRALPGPALWNFACLGCAVLVMSFGPVGQAVAAPSDDLATIKRQSQEFSDASASGDAKTLAKLLDDDVLFMEESGALDSKQDIVSSAQPSLDGIKSRLVQSDLIIKFHGDIAVTGFTDSATTTIDGQKSISRFRSTEVWQKKNDAWKMISSETLALPEDPPAITLPAAHLDQYTGNYNAGPKFKVNIKRQNKNLFTATNGGKASTLLAEAPDVFFVAGQPRQRRIFVRDASGKIAGFTIRREGHDLLKFNRES